MKTYLGQGNKQTPQSQPIPGSPQVANSAGGYSFEVDQWKQLDRFLILGSEGGTYYISEKNLTTKNVASVRKCVESDGLRVVRRVVEISDQGRAPKNDPALFVLALCAGAKDPATRQAALAALPQVARIGTHLFHFVAYAQQFRGWGRGLRTAVANWYQSMPADKLAYQMIKYQSRDGWSNHDLLHHVHAKGDPEHNAVYRWAKDHALVDGAPQILEGANKLAVAQNAKEAARLIVDYRLPREIVPTAFLSEKVVWEALLADMPLTAMIRNLATMTKIGLIEPLSDVTRKIAGQLVDGERLKKSRVHPIAMLFALKTYEQGHGERGNAKWEPVSAIVDALNDGFYLAFGAVEPTNQRLVLALDVSGSMGSSYIAGAPSLSAREGSAAMALITARVEPNYTIVGFSTSDRSRWSMGSNMLVPISISPKQRLDDVVRKVSDIPMGGTDCALPMLWALEKKIKADAFVIFTDSETWAGDIHPVQALQRYRNEMGIPARLIVVGMCSNEFSIADPSDAGMLDVAGFDTATPQVISDFSAGKI